MRVNFMFTYSFLSWNRSEIDGRYSNLRSRNEIDTLMPPLGIETHIPYININLLLYPYFTYKYTIKNKIQKIINATYIYYFICLIL